jgi:glycosyltransferase involved in cell wall biosynthesis
MTLRVLAIGDLSNNIVMFKKFVQSDIHLINFPWEGPSKVIDIKKDVEFFKSAKVKENLKRINEIKDDFDICIAMSSTGLLMSYLADLNYIAYFCGHDIRSPPFVKDMHDPLSTNKPIYDFNAWERSYYKKAYDNAIAAVVTDDELLEHLKKYRDDYVRITGYIVDTTIFNPNVKPIEKEKNKFTFLSPARMGLQKGTEKIWKALDMCKSDFEIIQIKWYDNRNSEEEEIAQKWIDNPPKQVKFVPIMPREELGRYMVFADAILGQVSGIQADVERSGALCKKAVVHYANPERMYIVNDKIIPSPFLPHSNEPKMIAETIDKIVTNKEFREKLAQEEYEFVMNLSEPNMIAKQWDELFEKMNRKYHGAVRGTSKFRLKLRVIGYLIANRLHRKKIKRVFKN